MASPSSPSMGSSFSFTRQLYPARPFRLPAQTTPPHILPAINEVPSTHPTSTGWDIFPLQPGQMSPAARSTAQFSSTSSWFPGTVQRHNLNRKDIGRNIAGLEDAVRAAERYEEALREVSRAGAGFADALDGLSRAKDLSRPLDDDGQEEDEDEEEGDIVEELRSLSGYQYYIASQQRVLAQLVHEQCTSPLEEQSKAYRHTLITLQTQYTKTLGEKTTELKRREKQHVHESQSPNLQTYRRGLEDLTSHLDALDHLKYEHYETVAEHTRAVWRGVVKRAAVAARAQVDIFERVSERGVQCDCLGRMIAGAGDPFDVRELDVIRGVQRELTSLDRVNGVNADEGGGEEREGSNPSGVSAPTAPSPPPGRKDPFEVIDEVPSVYSASDEHLPSMDTNQAPVVPGTMTPPLTPILSRDQYPATVHEAKYLTVLGGYGWRG